MIFTFRYWLSRAHDGSWSRDYKLNAGRGNSGWTFLNSPFILPAIMIDQVHEPW